MDTATAATPKSTTGVLGPSALGWQVGQGRLPEDVRDFVVNYVAVGAGEPAPARDDATGLNVVRDAGCESVGRIGGEYFHLFAWLCALDPKLPIPLYSGKSSSPRTRSLPSRAPNG